MTPEKIDQWLTDIGKDRPWLADQMGLSMGTLYNGFSKGFTKRSLKRIQELMLQSQSAENDLKITFTAQEFERIETARKLLGIATRKLFYEEAINEYAAQIIAREADTDEASQTPQPAKNVYYLDEKPSSLVAENITPYNVSSGVQEKKKSLKDKTGTED